MSVIGSNQLRAPIRPKMKDPDLERVIRELQDKIVDIQTVLRAVVKKLGI
jgi:hypothetical protein